MIRLTGNAISGIASASGIRKSWDGDGSISLQMKFLRNISPELIQQMEACVMATINVAMLTPIPFEFWEHTFEEVFWLPGCTDWSEKISFTPIVFHHGAQKECAWIYKAYRSPHRNDPYLLEVIAPPVEGLCCGNSCTIEISRRYLKAVSSFDARKNN